MDAGDGKRRGPMLRHAARNVEHARTVVSVRLMHPFSPPSDHRSFIQPLLAPDIALQFV